MRSDKEKKLMIETMENCAILYCNKNLPMTQSLCCFGWECGSGWFYVLNEMSCKLEALNLLYYPKYKVKIQADQVKEKFGTLRFYFSVICEDIEHTKEQEVVITAMNSWAEEIVHWAEDECYKTCEAPACVDPGRPDNATSSGWWFDQPNIESRWYYGSNTCETPTDLCDYIDINCKTNYYLNKDIFVCTTDNNIRTCVAPASEKSNACVACSSLPGGYDTCSPNSLTVFGGGPEMCHSSDVQINCTTLLPYPAHAQNCTYQNYLGTEITFITGGAYYPDGDLQAYTYNTYQTDAYGNQIYKPKGCYMKTCTCEPGYKFTPAVADDPNDPGACVPDVFKITLNDNGGTGGIGTIYEKYSVGWYSNSDATASISTITKPTLDANHSFNGYYDAQTGGNLVIPATGTLPSPTVLTANKTLYAQWTEDSYPCTAGQTARGETCPTGSYCPGGQVSAAKKNDPVEGCARKCPSDVAGGTPTSPLDSTQITQCSTTRTNVALDDETGAGDQTCFYNPTAAKYDNSCTIAITSCVAGRYRELPASITCAVVGRGAYSPANDVEKHLCSDLNGADDTVTTETDTSASAAACYNTCSDIAIANGSRVTTNDKEVYNGTNIPACTYTTTCNNGCTSDFTFKLHCFCFIF